MVFGPVTKTSDFERAQDVSASVRSDNEKTTSSKRSRSKDWNQPLIRAIQTECSRISPETIPSRIRFPIGLIKAGDFCRSSQRFIAFEHTWPYCFRSGKLLSS